MKQLFPEFVPNSVLRFFSLLGPPKISVAAKLWTGAKRPAKKPPRTEEFEWKFDFDPPPPPPTKLLDSDEVTFITVCLEYCEYLCFSQISSVQLLVLFLSPEIISGVRAHAESGISG